MICHLLPYARVQSIKVKQTLTLRFQAAIPCSLWVPEESLQIRCHGEHGKWNQMNKICQALLAGHCTEPLRATWYFHKYIPMKTDNKMDLFLGHIAVAIKGFGTTLDINTLIQDFNVY